MGIHQGTICGFPGANDAGKASIFQILTKLRIHNSGSVHIWRLNMLDHRNRMLSLLDTHTLDCFAFHRKAFFIRFQEFLKARNIFRIGRKC